MSSLYQYNGDSNNSLYIGNFSTESLPVEPKSLSIEILKKTYLISLPIICLTGVVGNILAVLVFVSKQLRRASSSWYLAARSTSDGGFLFASFLTWTSDVSKLRFFHTDGLCQVIVFMTYVFAFLSVWLTVVVTIENYIRICRPFSVQTFCNVMIARRTILALVIIGIILYNYPFWTSKVFVTSKNNTTTYWCNSENKYNALLKWLSYLDMLITLIIPSLIIVILMIAITFSLIKSLKRQSRLQSSTSQSIMNNGQVQGSRRNKRSNSSPQAKVTHMLFAVSFFFILLNGPFHVIRLIMEFDTTFGNTRTQPSVKDQVQVVTHLIYYLSFSVNLAIYLTCGDSFRKQFKETCFYLCVRHASPSSHSEVTVMTAIKIEETDHKNEDQTALINKVVTKRDNETAICS